MVPTGRAQVVDNEEQRLEDLRGEHPRLYRAVMFTMQRRLKATVRILGAFYVACIVALYVLLSLSTVFGLSFFGFMTFVLGAIFAFGCYIGWYLRRPQAPQR